MPEEPPKRPGFGALQLPAIDAKLKPGTFTLSLGPLDEQVLFSFRTRRGLYLRLLQMLHHKPGHFQLQDFLTDAIEAALSQHPEADMPIPPDALQALVNKNKKLQAGNK
jgi:hypothetical protein